MFFDTLQRRNGNEDIQWRKILPLDFENAQSIAKPAKGLARTLEENKTRLDKAEI